MSKRAARRAYTINVQWKAVARTHVLSIFYLFRTIWTVEKLCICIERTLLWVHQIIFTSSANRKFEFISSQRFIYVIYISLFFFGLFRCHRVPFFPLSSNWIIIRLSAQLITLRRRTTIDERLNNGKNNINALFAVCTKFCCCCCLVCRSPRFVYFAWYTYITFSFFFYFLGKC